MAAAAILTGLPIILEVLKGPVGDLLGKFLPGLFSALQKKHGPTTPANPDASKLKFETAYKIVLVMLQNMAADGLIPKQLPPDEKIKEQVQKIYDWAAANGLIEGKPASGLRVGSTLVVQIMEIH